MVARRPPNGWRTPLIRAITGTAISAARTEPWFEAAARAVSSDTLRFTPFVYADAKLGRETILAAHRRAVEVIKSGPGRCEVGLTLAMQDIQAGPGGEEDGRAHAQGTAGCLPGKDPERRLYRCPDILPPAFWS